MSRSFSAAATLLLLLCAHGAAADDLLDRFGKGKGKGQNEGTAPSTEPSGTTAQKRRVLKPNEKVDLNECLSAPTSCLCPPNTIRTEIREAKWGTGEHYSRMTCLPKGCPAGKIVRQVTSLEGSVSFRCASPGKWN